MSLGGSQQPVTTTQSSAPWSGAQPHLTNVMSQGENLYNQGIGYQPYAGPTQAPMHPWLDQSLNATVGNLAQEPMGSTGLEAARKFTGDVVGSQGITPGLQGAAYGLGNAANQYTTLAAEASGAQNPYLLAEIAANDRRIADKVNSSMSGAGRYGSGAHTDVLSRALAEAANPILAQDYARRQAQRMQAMQGYQSTQQNLADLYSRGLSQAGQAAQLTPGLDAARFANLDKLTGIGQYMTDRGQADLAGQIQLYNAQQAYPWEQLARYSGVVGGMGGLGGTTIKTTPSNAAPTGQRILGGALGGAGLGSMFGPLGAGVGALGGGLLGLF